MSLSHAREIIQNAVERGTAVPAFNVISLEYAEAVIAGAESAGVPVILQVSENAIRFHGGQLRPLLAACREIAVVSRVPVAIHLDHIESESLVEEAIGLADSYGLSSIMFDASREEYGANVAATARIARQAHDAGLWVEAELGEVGGKDGAHAPGARTEPREAADFVSLTGVDSLAVAVGSSHAMLDRSAALDFDLISDLAAALPVPLVLHGSSGVADASLTEAVKRGMRKINIGTALNISWTGAVRSWLEENPAGVDPRKYSGSARDATAAVVAHLSAIVHGGQA